MSLVIDGNFNDSEKKSKIKNLGPVPRVSIALLVVIIAFSLTGLYFSRYHELSDQPEKDVVTDFIENFFLGGHENGSDACSSIDLSSSYDSCVIYYDEIYYPEYKDVRFEYTIDIVNSLEQHSANVFISNPTSASNNFTYTEIRFNLVYAFNQDRYYEYNESSGQHILKNYSPSYEILFQTMELIS